MEDGRSACWERPEGAQVIKRADKQHIVWCRDIGGFQFSSFYRKCNLSFHSLTASGAVRKASSRNGISSISLQFIVAVSQSLEHPEANVFTPRDRNERISSQISSKPLVIAELTSDSLVETATYVAYSMVWQSH
jgi:hypothetical protein